MIKPKERYKHFKGDTYEILCLSKHVKTKETLVNYFNIEKPNVIWSRPLDSFKCLIDTIDNEVIKRFEKI